MQELGLSALLAAILNVTTGGMNSDAVNANDKVVTQYPVETVMTNVYNTKFSDTLYASVDDQPLVVKYQFTPQGEVLFNNQRVQSTQVVSSIKIGSKIINNPIRTNYFTLEPFKLSGHINSKSNYHLTTQTAALPKMASIGDSKLFATQVGYADSSQSEKVTTYTQTWSLSQADNNHAWFCVDSLANLLLDYDPDGTTTECFKINAKGDVLESKVIISMPKGESEGFDTITFTRK